MMDRSETAIMGTGSRKGAKRKEVAVAPRANSNAAGGWTSLMAQAADLHPITRAGMGFHPWSLAGLGQQDDRLEAAVTAARIAASEGRGAARLGTTG